MFRTLTSRGLLSTITGAVKAATRGAIASNLTQPLAILQGEGEQLVSLDYLRTLSFPHLWRHEVQLIPGAGHAPHQETPEAFTALLQDFLADLS